MQLEKRMQVDFHFRFELQALLSQPFFGHGQSIEVPEIWW